MGVVNEKYVSIKESELEKLREIQNKFLVLQWTGLDNWEGAEIAQDRYEEEFGVEW